MWKAGTETQTEGKRKLTLALWCPLEGTESPQGNTIDKIRDRKEDKVRDRNTKAKVKVRDTGCTGNRFLGLYIFMYFN